MANKIYAILDTKTGAMVPKTHYLCLKNDVEAVYTLINFAAMLNNRFVTLVAVAKQNDDNCTITSLVKAQFLTDFTGVPDFLETLDNLSEDVFYSAGISKENLLSSFSFALENILMREEKLGIMRKLSGDLSSFEPAEIEKMKERLSHIETLLNEKRW